MPIDKATGQCNGGNFSFEGPFSQMSVVGIKLTKNNQWKSVGIHTSFGVWLKDYDEALASIWLMLSEGGQLKSLTVRLVVAEHRLCSENCFCNICQHICVFAHTGMCKYA